jgi:hypothetical protein
MLTCFLWARAKLTFCSTREDAAAALLPRISAQDLYTSLGGERDDQARPRGASGCIAYSHTQAVRWTRTLWRQAQRS